MKHSLRILCIKFAVILLLVSIFSWCGYKRLGCPAAGVDDANIFMVYAKHFSAGHGFVYNIGGERVEGFSSLLYVLILASLYSLSSNPERLIWLFNVLIVSCGLTSVTAYLDKLNGHDKESEKQINGLFSFESLLVLAFTFSCPAYVCWTTVSLMDAGLWSSLLLVSSVITCRALSSENRLYKNAWYVCIPLMVMTRPEALLWVPGLLSCYGIIRYLNTRDVKSVGGEIAASLIIFVASELSLMIFRLCYFGFPFPNTYYAKVSPDMVLGFLLGLGYAKSFIMSSAITTSALICAPLYLLLVMNEYLKTDGLVAGGNNYRLCASIMCVFALIMPVVVGGDHFRWFRFYQFIWPLIALPLYGVIDFIMRHAHLQTPLTVTKNARCLIIGCGFMVFSLVATPSWYDNSSPDITHEGRLASRGRKVGDVLNIFFNPDLLPTVGVVSAGGIKYTYQGIVYDLMGLNNVAMAHYPGDRQGIRNHAAFSKEIFNRLNPHILLPMVSDESPAHVPFNHKWYGSVFKGMLNDEEFKARYSFVSARSTRRMHPCYVYGYFRNDFIRTLKAEKICDISFLENPPGS